MSASLVLLPKAATLAAALQLSGGVGPQVISPPDSHAIASSLRSAQRRFEWVRRHHLPWVYGTPSGRCDVVVGRYCYWDDDEEPTWRPKPEHDRITRERHALLERLDSAAAVLPGDRWIAGQRVRYLVETARYLDALWAARACRSPGWWCPALAGFVLHHMGDYAAAESAFDAALAEMSERQRCDWVNISLLLEGKGTRRYREGDCATQDSLNRSIWWLADPMYLVPGNERRTEHLARLVLDRILDGTAIVYGTRWGKDNRELVLRYGWAIGWEREPPRGTELRPHIVGHHADGGKRFLPPFEYIEDPRVVTRDEWEIDPSVPQTRAAMRYATEFRALEHQLAVFRRTDSAIVVVGYDLWETSNSDDRERIAVREEMVRAGFFLSPDPRLIHDTQHAARGGRGAFALRVPLTSMLISIEALDRHDSLAARSRYWVDLAEHLPDGFAVSDILLLTEGPAEPSTLDEAIPRARGSARYTPGDPIEIYWEVYGAPTGTAHEVSVSVTRLGKGFLRKAVEWMGLAGDRRPATFRWEGTPGDLTESAGRALGIRLAEEDEGRYLLQLEIKTSAGATATREREFEVRRR
jgi:hypothetical protein